MQKAITLLHQELTIRGMEHIPEHLADRNLPAVILFHGFTGTKLESHRLFLKISNTLEKLGFAIFRFDFLGNGESDGCFEDMTVSKEVSEASAILDFVRNDPRIDESNVHLLGFSMGGLVASILAGDRPVDIKKLILLAPAGNMLEVLRNEEKAFSKNANIRVIDRNGHLLGRNFIDDLRSIQVFERAKNYAGEVLLLHGTMDNVVPYEVSYQYKHLSYSSTQSSVYLLEGADHTFNTYRWEVELIHKICSFLQD